MLVVLIGEVTSIQEMVGGTLIILGCLVNEINFDKFSKAHKPTTLKSSVGNQTKLL